MTTPPSRPLHAIPQRPYYIEAPAYRRNSAGIRVMHLLCHLLNRSGHDAYLYPTAATNPLWHTPVLTPELAQQHAQAGRRPITVYPEVVSGNPRNGTSVVRYLLNRPGLIGGDAEFPVSDLIFAYTQHLLPDGEDPEHVLFMPPIDSSIFHNSDNPHDGRRQGWLLYPGRHAAALEEHKDLAAQCTLITHSWPASPQEMAALFRQSERVFCFESTSIALEAILCGCPAVVLPSPLFNGTPLGIEELGTHGLAFANTPEAIQEAIAGIPLAQEKYAKAEDRFWEQLDAFIRDTQAMPCTPVAAAPPEPSIAQKNFLIQSWLNQRQPGEAQARLIAQRLEEHAQTAPRIDFIILPGAEPLAARTTLRSLQAQSYPHTGAQVAPDADAATLNALAAQSEAQWLCFVQAGTTLAPAGITPVALELLDAPGCRAAYADEIVQELTGEISTLLRPDFNLDMLLSWPAGMARHWFFRRDVFLEAGGFDVAHADAHEFDLLLRLIDTGGLAGLGHVHEPVFIASPPPLANNAHEVAAIERHLRNRGYEQAVVDTSLPGRYRILYGHAAEPLVSIIIPTRDQFALLERCVSSLLEKTAYPHYEILLVDNGSTDPAACTWLDGLAALGEARIRVLRCPQPFNYAALNNLGANEARGDYLVLLNNDTAIVRGDWLDALLNHAQRPEVGVVGAKLLFPSGQVQHAGLRLGLLGMAGYPFSGLDASAPGYMHRLEIDQNYSAVSAACMMVRRSLYEELGGMDAQEFPHLWADVDLCLRARGAGYLTVWTPHATLLHEGGASRASLSAEENTQQTEKAQDALYRHWLPVLARDPASNRNVSLQSTSFEVETDASLNWNPLIWRPVPTVLAIHADAYGCGHYRIIHPGHGMTQAGIADVRVRGDHIPLIEMERLQPDTWVLQRQVTDVQYEFIQRTSKLSRAFKVGELDDYLPNLPMKSAHRSHMPKDILRAMRRWLSAMDRFVVSTEPLAEALGALHRDIRVVHNRLPPERWRGLKSLRQQGRRPRVGWAGGVGHQGDLELIADVVKALAGEVDWVFFGMCPEHMRKYVHEFHGPTSFEKYPKRLANLDLDLALAPLEYNLFNDCKSNLRLLEYGACGFPVVCTDALPYRCDLPVTRVKNRYKDWVDAIRMHTNDLDATAAAGDALRAAVLKDWMLEGEHLEHWLKAWLPD